MLWPICAICKILNVEIVESKCRETRDANKNDMAQVETHAINVIISCVSLYYNKGASGTNYIIGSPESRVFILVALARVSASNWFNIMTLYYHYIVIILNQLLALTRASATRIKTRDHYIVIILNQLLALTRASATRIKTRDSGLPMII